MKKSQLLVLAASVAVGFSSCLYGQEKKDDVVVNIGQASVKIYGVADVFYGNLSGKLLAAAPSQEISQDFSGFGSGGLTASRLGFAGEAPILNGYKGLFAIELGPLSLDNSTRDATYGNGLNKTRKSYVGVAGDFGSLIAGRLQSPAFDWSFKYAATSGAMDPVFAMVSAVGAGINAADRLNDAVTYASPAIADVKFKATYSAGKQNNVNLDDGILANHKQNAWLLAADYDKGPLSIGVVYRQVGDTSGVCASAPTSSAAVKCSTPGSVALRDGQKEWAIGGIYKFSAVKVFAAYQTVKLNRDGIDKKIINLGAEIPVSAEGKVLAQSSFGNGKTPTGDRTEAKAITLAYAHDMNRYLTAYVAGIYGKNDSDALFGNGLQLKNYTSAVTVPAGTTASPGSSLYGAMTGLRFTF